MTKQQNIKIKKTLPVVKLENKSIETREHVSKWLDAQGNYSASIISIIEHMIDRFGYVDVMDYEIAKKLHNEENNIQSEIKVNANSLPYDAKEEAMIEKSIVEKNSEPIGADEKISIEINLQKRKVSIKF